MSDRDELLQLVQRLDQSQWAPLPQRLARQREAGTLLLRHAAATVPFYADFGAALPGDGSALSAEAWQRLPLLTRADVQRHAADLLSREIPPQHLPTEVTHTSGSTGAPIDAVLTNATRMMWDALLLRELAWQGMDRSRTFAAIRYVPDHGALYPTGIVRPDWGMPMSLLGPTGAGALLSVQTDVGDQIDWLLRIRPAYLLTYPSNALALGEQLVRDGIRLPGLRHLQLIAETLDADQRRQVERDFGVPVFDTYSSNELGFIASQCAEAGSYHVHAESVMVEVLADDGRPCGPGEVGRVVATTLHNFAMPLIRYEIGYYAEVGEPCRCGRGLPTLRRVLGRTRNMLTLPTGERHWPHFGAMYWRAVAPVVQSQILQHSPRRLEARLVVERPLTVHEIERLRASMIERAGGHPFDIQFTFLDRIERSAAGKFEEFKSLMA